MALPENPSWRKLRWKNEGRKRLTEPLTSREMREERERETGRSEKEQKERETGRCSKKIWIEAGKDKPLDHLRTQPLSP